MGDASGVGLGDACVASALASAAGAAVAAAAAEDVAPGVGPMTVVARKTAAKKVTAALLLS